METYLYTCKHCNKEFRPTRRGVQKFCSDSCRVGHHQCNTRMTQRIFDSLAISNDSTKAVAANADIIEINLLLEFEHSPSGNA